MMRGFVDHRRCGGKQLRCHLVAARPTLLRATWCMGARGARTTWLESIGHPSIVVGDFNSHIDVHVHGFVLVMSSILNLLNPKGMESR